MKKLFFLLLLISFSGVAQDHGDYDFTPNQSRADQLFERKYYGRALTIYEGLIKKKNIPNGNYITLKIAECYRRINKIQESEEWYRKASFDEAASEYSFYYAEVLMQTGKYEEARKWYQDYLLVQDDPVAQKRLESIQGMDRFYRDSAFYDIQNLALNSEQKDFSPFFAEEGIVFVSSRKRPIIDEFKQRYHLDESLFLNLYRSSKPTSDVDKDVNFFFKKQLGTAFHEGPGVIFDNGVKMFFTRNNVKKGHKVLKGEDGFTRLKLFYAERKDTKSYWDQPVELPFNDANFSNGHPAILDNGNTLVFVSDRPGTMGKADLFISHKEGETWSEPTNLGPEINSPQREMFPFISKDGSTLYYASEGLGGLGGLDIFRVAIKDGEFGLPVNVGYPVNSSKDDFGFIVDATGKEGFFASNREGGKGDDDIYYFNYTKPPFVRLEGVIVDEDSREPLEEADITLRSKEGVVIASAKSGPLGDFGFDLEWDQDYEVYGTKATYSADSTERNTFGSATLIDDVVLEIKKELIIISGVVSDITTDIPLDSSKVIVTNETTGEKFGFVTADDGFYQFLGQPDVIYSFKAKKYRYFTELGQVSTMGIRSATLTRDFDLEPIVLGRPIALGDIYFDLDKWDITTQAAVELDKFVSTLEDNPAIVVELGSHTDSRGSDAYNLRLSQRRAASSVDYVISEGIADARIESKGYGETELTNECDDGVVCAEERHSVNRRSEFKVLGFLPDEATAEEQQLLWLDPSAVSDRLLSEGGNDKVIIVNKNVNSGTGILKGVVRDEDSGQALANVRVILRSTGSNVLFEQQSRPDGSFSFSALPVDNYQLIGVLEGYIEAGERIAITPENLSISRDLDMKSTE